MGLDIWFKDDIANILRAANEASLSAMLAGSYGSDIGGSGERGMELRHAYRRGFVAALATLARALGLPVTEIEREPAIPGSEPRLIGGHRRLAPPMIRLGGQQCEK